MTASLAAASACRTCGTDPTTARSTGRWGDLPARPNSEAPPDRVRGRLSSSWPAWASASVVVAPANAQVFQARIRHPGAGAQVLGIVAAAGLNLFVFEHD